MIGTTGIGAGFKSMTKRLLLAAGAAATGGGSVFSPISKYNIKAKEKEVNKNLEKSKIDKAKLKRLRKHAVKQRQIEIAESNNYKH